jgi:GLPGLI family protein
MKTLITLITLLIATVIQSQNFTGTALYKTSQKSNFSMKSDKNGMDKKLQEQIRQRIQKMNQKTFILNFDKTTSTYKEKEKLKTPNPKQNGITILSLNSSGTGNGSIYFKNIKEKRYAHKTEIQGKVFLINDRLPNHEWELTSETKNIGNYTCYKATYSKEVEKTKMTIVDGDTKKDKTKETKTVTAWYTPQIPISNGPDRYHGLPGLILEINDGKKVIVCTEIKINPTEKIKITEPTKGKKVDGKTFAKIQRKKSKELMEKMKTGLDLGNGIKIKAKG